MSWKTAVWQLCKLIASRSKKGVYDEDPRIHCNFGFLEEKAMIIDVGRLKRDPQRAALYAQDLPKITRRFYRWLSEESPELALYLQECIEHASTL